VDWAVPDLAYGSARALTDVRYTGTIKSYNPLCGYGFITGPAITEAFGKDLYLSSHQVGNFSIGDEVAFAVLLNKGKPQAFDLTPTSADSHVVARAAAGPAGKAKGKGKPLDADCNGKGSWNGPGAIVGFTGWGEDPPMQGGKCGLSAGKGPGGDCGFGGDWGLAAWEKGCGKTGWGPPVGAWPEWDWRWDDGSKGWGRGPPWEPRAASGSPPVSKGACPGGPGRPGATGLVPPTPCRSASGKGVAGKKSQVEMPGVTDRRFWGMVKSCGKEFGFIICNDLIEHFGKDDIYVHATNLEGYQAGDAVTFAIIVNEQWKPQAVTLQPAVADAGNARKRPRVENGGLAMGVTSGTKSAVEVPGVTDRRFVGHVKSRGREYGFLLCEELSQFFGQNDVFVHTNNLANFKVGDGASFVVLVNDKGKPQAADLRPEGG